VFGGRDTTGAAELTSAAAATLTAPRPKSSNFAMMINIPNRLSALSTEALAFVALDRAEAMARQWLGGNPSSAHAPLWPVARSLALELALSVPSVMGTTAFDRLARAMKGRSPDDIAAAALLRRSRIRLARISGRLFEDLATGQTSILLPSQFSGGTGDGASFGLFTPIDDEHIVAPRALIPLDDEALLLARSFVRPGNLGLGNGVRCAEAVYRHIVRNGIAPPSTFGTTSTRKPKLPFRPDENRLDALAAAWARLGRDPSAQELAQARGFASKDTLPAQCQYRPQRRGARTGERLHAYRRRPDRDHDVARGSWFGAGCQCRMKSPQKCRLKIPHSVTCSVCVDGCGLSSSRGMSVPSKALWKVNAL
jgi:hypothetical protein